MKINIRKIVGNVIFFACLSNPVGLIILVFAAFGFFEKIDNVYKKFTD